MADNLDLKATKFLSVLADRFVFASQGASDKVKGTDGCKENELAKLLHPKAQFLKIAAITEHSPDMKSYTLVPDETRGTKRLAPSAAGQYLSVTLNVDGMTLARPYSIASSPLDSENGEYTITVKRVEGGIASGYILDNWKAGDAVRVSEPLGDFTYESLRDAKTVIGIAGGSGITPFRAFARAIEQGDEDFELILLYGSRTLEDAVFYDELSNMKKVKLVNVLSEEKKADCENGFVTAKLIKKYAPKGDYSVFMCGPQAMYDFLDGELEKLKIRRKFIRRELFGEQFHPEKNADYAGDPNAVYNLTVITSQGRRTVPCSGGESLLRAMEKAGIAAPNRCRSGSCGFCHSYLESGEVYVPKNADSRRAADAEYGYIHTCCSFPLSDVTVSVGV